MNAGDLTVTIEASQRPWWRPLGLRSLRIWYQHARRSRHGRLLSAALALLIARKEFRFGDSRKRIA